MHEEARKAYEERRKDEREEAEADANKKMREQVLHKPRNPRGRG